MLKVTGIEKGIVIDHITAGKGLKIFQKLKLDKNNTQAVLLMNVPSQQLRNKDIIKIQDDLDIDLKILGLIDPNITVNYIEGEKIQRKMQLSIPEKVKGLFECKNPRCITTEDQYAVAEFTLVKNGKIQYRCNYCEELTEYKL
ncbi:aspartate carbamoyltransferase regulatory subunit [Alkaliphilus transvaalensis]|uniref:aspartate carbamoyltransferase regulatory subunit n=1 Tax=Alkaliphilus transvaalensis TaxID=114628 RepID=UPI00047D3353|nr:aspartate carbamoyltransferase regulatory subunit [Alkaliphilus transvaalensis]